MTVTIALVCMVMFLVQKGNVQKAATTRVKSTKVVNVSRTRVTAATAVMVEYSAANKPVSNVSIKTKSSTTLATSKTTAITVNVVEMAKFPVPKRYAPKIVQVVLKTVQVSKTTATLAGVTMA